MCRGGTGLRTAQECGTDLCGPGTSGQDASDGGTGRDATSRDEGQIHPVGQELEERQQSVVLAVFAVDGRAAMAAGLDALGDQGICPGDGGVGRLGRVGHRHPDFGSGVVESANRCRVRAAEGERDDRYPLGDGQLELGGEPVVVVARLAQFHTVPVGFPGDLGEVGRKAARLDLLVGHKEIQPVRSVGEPT